MLRNVCASCGGHLDDFLDLGASPPADTFPAGPDAQESWYPLRAAVCAHCWLVQLREIVPDDELYGDDYGFRTGSSPSAVADCRQLAARLLLRYPEQARKLTVEIACNDGTLLQDFVTAGCPALGVEPVKPAAAEAAARGVAVCDEPFTAKLAEELRDLHGPAGLVVARNVVAHVVDPKDFLAGISLLLDDDGIAVIEFQNAADLIAGCQFDHVYHEHRFFFSLHSFSNLAAVAGWGSLTVLDWERIPAQGGSLRVVLVRHPGWVLPNPEPWLTEMTPYAGMQARAGYARKRLLQLLTDEREADRVTAGYAASAKSATLLNFCGIGPDLLPWIEDITPGKIGRYTPGGHIPIRAPGTRPDTYLLTAWNYLPGVLRQERSFLQTGGRFIVPGPVPVLI